MPHMEDGTHRVTVTSSALGKTSSGKEQVAVTFHNEAGEHATWYGYFTDAALPYTYGALENLGWVAGEHDYRIESLHETDVLVGNEAEIVVESEEYEGKWRPKVKWVNSPGGGLRDRMEPEEATAFGRDLAKRLRMVEAERGAKPKPKAVARGNQTPDDYDPLGDIPF